MSIGFTYGGEQHSVGPDFGDYVTIEQKRFGVANEHYLYKVIGRLRSNTYCDVPVRAPGDEVHHREIVDVARCVCCGVSETKIVKFRVEDIRPVPGMGLRTERDKLLFALHRIAEGEGVYGAQAFEFKNIAREAVGIPKIGESA